MINQLRADFYRQTHTLGHYLLLILVILFSIVVVYSKQVGGVMVSAPVDVLERLSTVPWTLLSGIRGLTISSSVLMYAFISIFVMVIGYEFSQQTYKNTLVSGISRSGFIIAKFVTMLLDIFMQIVIFFLAGILTGMALGRSVGTSWANLFGTTLLTALIVVFFIGVVFSMAIVILMLTGSLIGSAVFIIIFPLLVSIISMISKWDWLKFVDFFGISVKISLKQLSVSQFQPYIWFSVAILIICFGLSLILIRRKEL
ncbi:MAG: ABC transporter permease [Lentilactobacillus hilgardii]|uniref:ABC transporter permease n=1 Tax=Lentilactobacillus hilgardii TaxID=1588 RepID=UPI001CC1D61E|nr:ABC transporter permease [Lentilactobacillus hilgardii]MBZ2199817.1 ABC transporter permease [Lentilactobacillus hilgardii]MBZ2203689.1 ABC transporter permease [Lentilactobacillus hilgardii]